MGQESAQGDLVKRNLIRILSVTVGILLLTVIVFGLGGDRSTAAHDNQALAATTDQGRGNISNRATETLSGPSAHSWTKESMLAAQPYPLEISNTESKVNLNLEELKGDPFMVPGSPPDSRQTEFNTNDEPLTNSQSISSGYSYPPPYARYQNFAPYEVYPYSTVGALFFILGFILTINIL